MRRSTPAVERGLDDGPDAVLVDRLELVLVPFPVGDEAGQVDDVAVPPHGRRDRGRVGDVSVERPHAGAPPGRGDRLARQDEGVDGPGAVAPDEPGMRTDPTNPVAPVTRILTGRPSDAQEKERVRGDPGRRVKDERVDERSGEIGDQAEGQARPGRGEDLRVGMADVEERRDDRLHGQRGDEPDRRDEGQEEDAPEDGFPRQIIKDDVGELVAGEGPRDRRTRPWRTGTSSAGPGRASR